MKKELQENRLNALALFDAGLAYGEIAEQLKTSKTTAWNWVTIARAEAEKQETIEAISRRHIESRRLDSIQAGAWSAAVGGDTKSARIVIECIKLRVQLHGTSAPIQTQSSITVETAQPTKDDVIKEQLSRMSLDELRYEAERMEALYFAEKI